MADEAVMDAAVETAIETTDTGADTGLDAGAEPLVPGGEPSIDPEPGAANADKPLIDGGKLSAEAKATLDKLKVENPSLARAIQRALFKEAEFGKLAPGGIQEIKALRETVEQLGGETGLQDMQREIAGFRGFDEQYTAGDPKAIDFMTSDAQGQEAFVKLMPMALQKFEQLHPEGFKGYMAQVMEQSMYASGIPLALERLGDFLADNPKAMEQWNKIAGFVKFVGDTSRKQVEAPKFQQAQPDNERAQLAQERASLERDKWKNETASASRPVFDREWARLAAGRKLSAEQTDTIKELFDLRFQKAIQNGHSEKLERYFTGKDKTGFMRYAATLDSTILPNALKEAFDRVLPTKPGPRPPGAPVVKNGAPARGTPIAQGFTQIAQRPATAEIDMRHSFNTPSNYQSGKAVLRDGRKVQWSRT